MHQASCDEQGQRLAEKQLSKERMEVVCLEQSEPRREGQGLRGQGVESGEDKPLAMPWGLW